MKIYLSKLLLISACLASLISACASMNENPLVGKNWVALQEITYPPRRTTINIQDGRVLERSNNADRSAPQCAINATKGLNQPLTIKEGSRFKITRVNHGTSAVNETMMIRTTRLQVDAANYPEITTIQCSIWGGHGGRHVSAESMQQTMKGVFALK